MANFLYFIPNQKTVCHDDVVRVGITVFESLQSVGYCGVDQGPGGQPGVVFSCGAETQRGSLPKIGYYPDWQTWQDCGEFLIGYEGGQPEPDDLQRAKSIAGHETLLGDGNQWTVPLARYIPQTIGFNVEGEPVFRPKNQLQFLQDIAERVTGWVYSGVDGDDAVLIDQEELINMALSVLAVNYRIGKPEADVLGLLDTDNVQEILANLVDFKTVIESATAGDKKKQSDADSLSSGAEV